MTFRNMGYYFVPFSVDLPAQREFSEYLSSSYAQIACFDKCRYLFSYVLEQFRIPDGAIRCYDVPFDPPEDFFKFYMRTPNADGSTERITVDTSSVKLESVRIYMCSEYLGFLTFHVDYGDLTEEEIEWFAFSFKRSYWKRSTTGVNVSTELLRATKDILGPLAELYFYEADEIGRTAHVLQLLRVNEPDPEAFEAILCACGRAHTQAFSPDRVAASESPFDMRYAAGSFYTWCGSPNVLSCIVNDADLTEDSLGFVNNVLAEHFTMDYLCTYLQLLNQRYTVMYLMRLLLQHSGKKDEDSVLDFVSTALDRFRNETSFSVISKEINFQNIYNKMIGVMEIDKLLRETEDINQRILLRAQRSEAEREQRTNHFLAVLSILAVGSALIDFSDFFDRVGIPPAVSSGISIALVAAAVVLGSLAFLRKK